MRRRFKGQGSGQGDAQTDNSRTDIDYEELLEEEDEEEEVDEEEEEDDFDDDEEEEDGDDGEEDTEPDDRINALESNVNRQMGDISNQIQQLHRGLTQNAQRQYTQEELNELHKSNPVGVMQYLIENQSKQSTALLERQMLKRQYDSEARANYPVNDPKFKAVLERHFADLVEIAGPENAKVAPKLLLNACRNAALEMGIVSKGEKSKKKTKTRSRNRGEDVGVEQGRSRGVKRSRSSKIADNDPRLQLYAANPGVTEEKIARFRKKLEEKAQGARRRRR